MEKYFEKIPAKYSKNFIRFSKKVKKHLKNST